MLTTTLRPLFYWLVTVTLLTGVAHSAPSCVDLFSADVNSQFETTVTDAWSAIKKLRINSDAIVAVEKRISTGGAYSPGVLRVRTKDGVFALKIFNEGYLAKNLSPTFVIQNAFANLGMAPRVHGVLTSKEMRALKEKFPEIDSLVGGEEVSIGVLMEEVPVESHLNNSGYDFIPKSWTKQRLLQRIEAIEAAMSQLRVPPPEDLQLVFDNRDRLLLLDFDRYAYFSKKSYVYGEFSPEGGMSVNTYVPLVSNSRFKPEFEISKQGDFKVRLHRLRKLLGLAE